MGTSAGTSRLPDRFRSESSRSAASTGSEAPRTIARLMTIGHDSLSKSETVTVAAIECGMPVLVAAREIITAFQAMIRKKSPADLEPWLERAPTEPGRRIRQRHHQGPGGRPRRDHLALVQRPDRRSDHQTQARETPDVRQRKARPPPGPRYRCCIGLNATKTASEPRFGADSQQAVKIGHDALDGLRAIRARFTVDAAP